MKTDPKVTLVIVGAADRQLEELLRDSGARVTSQTIDQLPSLAVAAHPPDAIIVDLRDRDSLPAALATLKRQHPTVGVVIVASALDPTLMLEAMRAGVTEWIPEPITAAGLSAAIQRVGIQRRPEATKEGQVFAFVGAKGGVGTTTVAVNVATALTKVAPRQSLLIDLHMAHGDAALFLGAEARFTTADVLENIHRLDEAYLRGVVTASKTGLHLLASAERAVPSIATADRVRELIGFATQHYRYLVLDVPRSDVTVLDSLDLATSIIIVANQELATVRRAGALALTLRQRYGKDRIGVVVNRFDRSADIGREDVERVTGGAVRHVIPSDYRLALDGLNKGQPVVVENHNRLAGSFNALAELLAGVAQTKPPVRSERSQGLFGRFSTSRS